MIDIRVKKLSREAVIPTKTHDSDSGWDLYAPHTVNIEPLQTVKIPLEIALGLPEGYEAQGRPRSGRSLSGLLVHFGTIDQEYVGELGVVVTNLSESYAYEIKAGQRVAQMVIAPVLRTRVIEVEELAPTSRGCKGFGSSGG